jgi:hypothetical protein
MRPQLIGAWVALLLATAPASATVLVPAELGELAREARAIVHGRVVSVEGVWTAGRRGIETVVTIEVATTIKGQPGREVSLRVPGGDLGRYRSVVVGAPVFREGQEVIVFLGGEGPALPHLLGLGQGVYRVRRDPRTGTALVMPPPVAAAAGAPVRVQRGDPARRTVGLDEFMRQVQAVTGGPGERDRAGRRLLPGKEAR